LADRVRIPSEVMREKLAYTTVRLEQKSSRGVPA
jgi:hypothetical protein